MRWRSCPRPRRRVGPTPPARLFRPLFSHLLRCYRRRFLFRPPPSLHCLFRLFRPPRRQRPSSVPSPRPAMPWPPPPTARPRIGGVRRRRGHGWDEVGLPARPRVVGCPAGPDVGGAAKPRGLCPRTRPAPLWHPFPPARAGLAPIETAWRVRIRPLGASHDATAPRPEGTRASCLTVVTGACPVVKECECGNKITPITTSSADAAAAAAITAAAHHRQPLLLASGCTEWR
mmetsp:Transcript_75507/g.214723  ORF Transcript_75507/g.214723 Transcript_75507/m.214723 type:complete len:231 (-) Transcript_75507:26-718(-)